MSNFLRYGDLIVLTHSEQEGLKGFEGRGKTEGETTRGVLTTLGFIDTGLYFQYLPKDERGGTDMANFKDGVFKITPRLNFDSHKELKKTIDYYESVEEALKKNLNDDEEEKLQAIRDDLVIKMDRLQERLKKEQHINATIIRENLGTMVKYGAEVQLMHYDSNTFVASSSDSSQTEKIGYTCFLGGWFTAGMIFKLLPKYKSRSEGDCIQIRDHLLILNVKRQAYLTIAADLDHTLYDDRECSHRDNPFIIDPQIVDPRTTRHRVYMAQEQQHTFQLMLYRKYFEDPADDVLLWGGDMVKVMHSEIEADLTADISYSGGGEPELYFRQYYGEVKDETFSAGSFWYIEHEAFERAGERFPTIDPDSNQFTNCSGVRLRHVLTNKLIVPIKSKEPSENEDFKVGLCKELSQGNSLSLTLEPVVTNLPALTHGQTVFIRDSHTMSCLGYNKSPFLERDTARLLEILQASTEDYEFSPLNEGDLSEHRLSAKFQKDFSSEDAYRLSRISDEERSEVLFLKSAIPYFKYVAKVFKEGTVSKEDWLKEACSLVFKSLQLIICFLFDKDTSSTVEFFTIEENPITRRQKFLRESGILCSLIDFVYRPFCYGMVKYDDLLDNHLLRSAMSLSYTTMRYSIKEYRPNELYLSQWIGLITEQSIKAQGACDICAGNTLVELIDNNKRILETRIHQKTIKWFIDFLVQRKEEHFVNILRVICICDGKPMIRNQKEISELLLLDFNIRDQLLFRLDPDLLDGILFNLDIPGYNRIPFKDFESVSKNQDGLRIYRYVVALTRLLADLCRDRNYTAIDELQRELSFDILYAVVSDAEYPYSLRDAFACLMLSLWVDISPLQKVDMPFKIKVWEEAKQNQLFKSSAADMSRYTVLKHFSVEYLKELKRVGSKEEKIAPVPGNEGVETKWSLDLAVLTLTNRMMWLGLYSEMNQINTILNCMKNYLRSDKGIKKKGNMTVGKTFTRAVSVFTSVFTSRTSLKKKIKEGQNDTEELESPAILIECKKKACEIMEFCILVANELRVGSYLNSFKEAIEGLEPPVLLFLEQVTAKSEESHTSRKLEAVIKDLKLPIVSSYFEKASEDYMQTLNQMMTQLFFNVNSQKIPLDVDKDEEMLYSLTDLIHYKNPTLKEYAIYLLSLLHTQGQQLGKVVLDLQIIDDRNSLAHFQRAKDYCSTINTIGDTIEKWYREPNSPEMGKLGNTLNKIYRSLLSIQRRGSFDTREHEDLPLNFQDQPLQPQWTQGGRSSLNGRLRTVIAPPPGQSPVRNADGYGGRRKNISPTYLDLKTQLNFSDIHQFHIDCENEIIDPFEQDLFRNSGIYEGLIKILKYDVEILKRDRPPEGIHILRKIYRILAKSSKNSLTNKHYLTTFLERFILPHFQECPQDLNTYFLVYELVVDNKLILLDETKVRQITDMICTLNENLPIMDFRRAFNFFILRNMMHYKKLVLQNNQNTVLGRLISKDFSDLQVSFYPTGDEESVASKASNISLSKCLSKANNKDVVIVPASVCYALAYLELLSSCAEERNPFAEGVCQSIISLETIQALLTDELVSLLLKKSMVRFLYHAYLAHDREIAFHIIEVFLNIIKALNKEFGFYIRKEYLHQFEKVDMDYLMILTDDAFTPWTVVVEEYIHLLIDCFANIAKRDLNLVKESEPYRIFQEFHKSLRENVNEAKYKLNSKSLEARLDDLIKHLDKAGLSKMPEQYRPRHMTGAAQLHRGAKYLGSARVKTNIVGRMNLFKKIETLIDFFFNSTDYKRKCSEESFELIRNFVYMERATIGIKEPVKLSKVFANISRFVEARLEDKSAIAHPETLVTSVSVFRRYIEAQAFTSIEKIPNMFEDDFWRKYQPMIQSRQDRLCALRIPSLICKILIASEDLTLLREAFLLGIALLWGGNPKVQEGFLNFFEEDTDSLALSRIRQLMLNSFGVISKNMSEKNHQISKSYWQLKKSMKLQTTESTIDYDHDRESVLQPIRNEVESLDQNYALCKCIFKFLQLLCEGHNNRVQTCLRQQGPVVTPLTCNFIASTANLWGAFIKFVNPQCDELGQLILSFLIESIQGPCEGNQSELYHNKMIEYTKDFMSDFLAERDYVVRGFDKTNSERLDALILKSIKVLQSMLEANNSEETYIRMGENIDLGYLMKKLTNELRSILGDVSSLQETTVETANLAYLNEKIEGKVFDARFSEAFEIFFFLATINDHTGCYSRAIHELRGVEALVYAFFASHSATIEIVFKDTIQKLFFVVHPACKFLDDDEKNLFLDSANRDSAVAKLKDFITEAPRLFDRMEHLANLKSCVPIVSEQLFRRARNLCFLIVLTINFYMFFSFEKEVRQNEMQLNIGTVGETILRVLGICHILMCLVVTAIWCVLNGKLVILDGWRVRFHQVRKYMLSLEENEHNKIAKQEVLLLLEKNTIDLSRRDILSILHYYYRETGRSFLLPKLEYFSTNIIFLLSNKLLGVQMFFIALSFVAFFARVRILYAVHLFDLIVEACSLRICSIP